MTTTGPLDTVTKFRLDHVITRPLSYVELVEESRGFFGDWIASATVYSALLQHNDDELAQRNVGQVDDTLHTQAASLRNVVRSLRTADGSNGNEVEVEVDNATSHVLSIRWMNPNAHNPGHSHHWKIQSQSTWKQWGQHGDLFLLSVMIPTTCSTNWDDQPDECLLGAYRVCQAFPSKTPHMVVILQDDGIQQALAASLATSGENTEDDAIQSPAESSFYVEVLVNDPTDALVVAAAALDPLAHPEQTKALHTCIQTLQTVLSNIQRHPEEAKYRSLTMTNSRIQRQIVAYSGAIDLLHAVGFQHQKSHQQKDNSSDDSDPRLVLPETISPTRENFVWTKAVELLRMLETRGSPQFVAELATPVPWQMPVFINDQTRRRQFGANNPESHRFITPDERWARTEQFNERRRSGAARRPNPGEAPSSRGRWGR